MLKNNDKIAQEFNFVTTAFLHDPVSQSDGTLPTYEVDLYSPQYEHVFSARALFGVAHYIFRAFEAEKRAKTPAAADSAKAGTGTAGEAAATAAAAAAAGATASTGEGKAKAAETTATPTLKQCLLRTKYAVIQARYDPTRQIAAIEIPHECHVHDIETTKDEVLAVQRGLSTHPQANKMKASYPIFSLSKGFTYTLVDMTETPGLMQKLVPSEAPDPDLDEDWKYSPEKPDTAVIGSVFYVQLQTDFTEEPYITRLSVRSIKNKKEEIASASSCCAVAAYLALQKPDILRHAYAFEQGQHMGRNCQLCVDVQLEPQVTTGPRASGLTKSRTFTMPAMSEERARAKPSYYIASDDEDDDDDDLDSQSLPFPQPLSRDAFSAANFSPSEFLTSLSGRHQTLADLQSELRDLSKSLNAELLSLVSANHATFLSLGDSLKGGDEKIEEVTVGVLGFQKEVKGIRDEVDARAQAVAGLLEEKKVLKQDIATAHDLLELAASVEELERLLMLKGRNAVEAGQAHGASTVQRKNNQGNAVTGRGGGGNRPTTTISANGDVDGDESEDGTSDTDDEQDGADGIDELLDVASDEDEEQAGDMNSDAAALSALRRCAFKYIYTLEIIRRVGGDHPFVHGLEARLQRIRETMALDLKTVQKGAETQSQRQALSDLRQLLASEGLGLDGDLVIALIRSRSSQLYHCVLSCVSHPAILDKCALPGATKRDRPDLHPGDLVFARIARIHPDGESELTCLNLATSGADPHGLGQLKGGMVFNVSIGLAQRLRMRGGPRASGLVVLERLGERLAAQGGFEVAVGANGRVRAKCLRADEEAVRTTVLIGRCLVETDEKALTVVEQEALVDELVPSDLALN
ncbi:hypothetical protein KEM52_003347 [Ascosphaera acerosa]|nr:hypothetical protein KEM52_003347 [Ascosphaera acerosa]